MVFVTVVMACWVKAQSAILRLLLAMRIFRVLMERPKPFSNCCWKPAKIEVVTEGLNKFAAELEELRVLFQDANKEVPVWKACEYRVLNVEVWIVSGTSPETPVPVPEVSGLLTGMLRSSMLNVLVSSGSKLKKAMLAVEPPKTAPGVPPPDPPDFALRSQIGRGCGGRQCSTCW